MSDLYGVTDAACPLSTGGGGGRTGVGEEDGAIAEHPARRDVHRDLRARAEVTWQSRGRRASEREGGREEGRERERERERETLERPASLDGLTSTTTPWRGSVMEGGVQ